MNKGLFKNILIVLLLTITIFSIFKYISSLKEKYDLLITLNQVKEQVANLQKDKQNLLQTVEKEKELQQKLTQKNLELKDNLKAGRNRLIKLFKDTRETQKTVEQLNSQISLLKSENTTLVEQADKLKLNFSQVSKENEDLKIKLSSIMELKKAIRELKRQVRKVGIEIKQKVLTEKIVEGNRGFLIKDGQFTYLSPTKVKIEVIPAPQKE